MTRSRPKSPRRKPKQLRAHDTVEVVLDAAARVLGRLGYAGATTNRIAAAAGVSVGTVYEYFENKDAVFDALIRRELERLVTGFRGQELSAALPLEVAVRALVAAGMAGMRYGPELFRALEAVPGAAFRRQLSSARKLVIDMVRQLLELHRSQLRVTDLDLAAFVVVSAVEGVGGNVSGRDLDDRLADEVSSLVIRYLTDVAGAAR